MVYLIHFDQPFRHASHYIGWTRDKKTLKSRIRHHQEGSGANLLRHVARAGIAFRVVRTWDDADRHFERRLKNRGSAKRICPVCKSCRTATGRTTPCSKSNECPST
jgi:predicted GIY-YIG superfamily endonuclease